MISFFGKTKRPEKPSIEDEKDFIIWVLKYYDAPDMKMFRRYLRGKNKLDYFVEKLSIDIIEALNSHPDETSLMDFLSKVNEGYSAVLSMINKKGGFWLSSPAIKASFIQLIAKMVTLPYFVKYKHGVDIPLWDFKLPEYEDL